MVVGGVDIIFWWERKNTNLKVWILEKSANLFE